MCRPCLFLSISHLSFPSAQTNGRQPEHCQLQSITQSQSGKSRWACAVCQAACSPARQSNKSAYIYMVMNRNLHKNEISAADKFTNFVRRIQSGTLSRYHKQILTLHERGLKELISSIHGYYHSVNQMAYVCLLYLAISPDALEWILHQDQPSCQQLSFLHNR